MSSTSASVVRIDAQQPWWFARLREIWEYRELLLLLTMRDLKVRYAQTWIGAAWVILQPLATALIFALVFGRWAALPSEGSSYFLFSFAALVPWTAFAQGVGRSGASIVQQSTLVTKVYFPRILLPCASTAAAAVDGFVALVVLILVAFLGGVAPTARLVVLVPALLFALCVSLGVGLWVAALSARYRDFLHAVPVVLQLWLFASPVAYSSRLAPESLQPLLGLNPMTGAIELFRWSILATEEVSFAMLGTSLVVGAATLVSGAVVFNRAERVLADLV